MTVEHVEVLVEEPSMEALLALLLPKMLAGTSFAIHAHQGKQDLLKKLPKKLCGYAAWIPEEWRIVVVADRDDDKCEELKRRLERLAADAGLTTKSKAGSRPYKVANRLAIEELEAWYFGDWAAVRQAYPRVATGTSAQAKYRIPDAIAGGTWEAFERLLKEAGYFKTGLRKIEAARAIAEHMVPGRNTSRSFQVLQEALSEISSR